MTHILTFLNKPYPFSRDFLKNTWFHLSICIFIAGFLLYFKPFGIANWKDDQKTLKVIGYGLVCFLMQTFLVVIRNIALDTEKLEYRYKVWHEAVWLTLMILSNAAVVFLYSIWILESEFTWSNFIPFLGIVFSVGVFPIMANILIKHHRFLSLNQKEAVQIEHLLTEFQQVPLTQSDADLRFVGENEKDELLIHSNQLLYIESMENYAQFVYLDDHHQAKKTVLRGTLKRFETEINSKSKILRCHRSFIVNLEKVSHITGNAQGYLLAQLRTYYQKGIGKVK
jgi:hypothetical protein